MSRRYEIEATLVALERAREHASLAEMGTHFISEVSHLIDTVRANREEGVSE